MTSPPGINRTTIGWRIGQVVGTIVILLFAVIGANRWWFWITFQPTSSGSAVETGLIWFGFLIWFIPWWTATGLFIALYGWRPVVSKIVLGGAVAMTAIAAVAGLLH